VNHTDHRAAGMAAVDAVYPAARNGMAFPWLARDGLEPHSVRRLYLFWSNRPSAWVDVTSTLERKLEALRAHPSQIRHPEQLEPRIRQWAAEDGARIGVEAAEAFRVIVIDEDEDEAMAGDVASAESSSSAAATAGPDSA
jgi:LmbE family N-acetylglucosaminyl deacetylase